MIHALLVDDEPLALSLLRRRLEETGEVRVVGSYTDPDELLQNIEALAANAVFADIEMGPISGLDLAEELQTRSPGIQVVFVTGHSDYAVKAFEIESVDYILKPITSARLKKTLRRLNETISRRQNDSPPANHEKPQISVNVFDDFQVMNGGQPVTFKTSKVKELLAFLILHRNTPIHRDILIEALWPGQEYKKAKIRLHTALSHLRKTLDSIGLPGAITFSNPDYHFTPGKVTTHLDLFEKSIAGALPEDQAEQVIRIYTGRLFAQNEYKWADEKAEQLHQHVLQLLDRLIDINQERCLPKALEYLQIQKRLEPYLERNVHSSMLLLSQQGNRANALRVYEDYARLLRDDLGIDPDNRLTELYELLAGK